MFSKTLIAVEISLKNQQHSEIFTFSTFRLWPPAETQRSFCKYLDWGKYLVNILLGGNILWISWLGATSCQYLAWGQHHVNILLGGNILWISWLGATSCEYLAWGQHHVNILIGVNILWISCLESIIEFVQEYLWTMERNLEAQLGVLEKGGRQYWFGQCLGQYLGQYLFWKVFGQYLFGQYLEQYWGNADFGQYWWRVVTMFRQYWLRQRINNIYLVNVGTIFNDIVTIFV